MHDPAAFRSAFTAALNGVLGAGAVTSSRPADGGVIPYAIVRWGVSDTRSMSGDAQTLGMSSQVEVALFEKSEIEDGSVALALVQAVNGKRFSGARVKLISSARDEDADHSNLVHTVITFSSPRLIND